MTARAIGRLGTSLTFPRTRGVILRALRGDLVVSSRMKVVIWWWLSLVALVVYSQLRGRMDDVGMPVHGQEWETTVLGGLPTIWLQHHFWNLARQELEWASVVVHTSWFFVPLLAGVFVSLRRPERIGSFFRWWIALEFVALPLFALLPMRPPWLDNGEVTRIIALRFGGEISDSNPLAAMPSLHVAFPVLIAMWFTRERWWGPAAAMAAYASVVSFEVVFSGEHYVVDVLGAIFVSLVIALASTVDWLGMAAGLLSSAFRYPSAAEGRLKPALEQSGNNRGERGQALIEMAFVLPIILVFILGLVDFGIAIDHRQVLQHAVRDGVRFGAVGNSVADVKAHTADQAIDLITTSDVDVCYIDENGNGNPGNAGDSIKVTAHYTYDFSVGSGELLSALGVGPPSIDMNPSATLRLESTVTGATACP